MPRSLVVLLTLLVAAVAAAPATAATDRCRPGPGEHQLARSAQAVVLTHTVAVSQSHPLQTLVGCSRTSGRRRVIDVFHRRDDGDPTRLVGLRLAGTRVAYVSVAAAPSTTGRTTITAEDAVHGGRRHELGGSWPFTGFWSNTTRPALVTAWAVDAAGDVAWIEQGPVDDQGAAPAPSLVLWHAGLGRRQIDAKAGLSGLKLAGNVLSWRRNGAPRTLDLAAIPRSACAGTWTTGTLDVDLNGTDACQRSSGRITHPDFFGAFSDPIDVNGPYVLVGFSHNAHSESLLMDVEDGTVTSYDDLVTANAVVDAHGSLAWVTGSTLWVHDANGTRAVPGTGAGGLTRDGSTVTWPGGPTVTLNP